MYIYMKTFTKNCFTFQINKIDLIFATYPFKYEMKTKL